MRRVEAVKSRIVLLGAMLLCLGVLLSVAMVKNVQADGQDVQVWFTYSDGTVQKPDDKNAIWLRETDTGVLQTDARAEDVVWSCEERFLVIGTGYHDHAWIDPKTGVFSDCEHVPTRGGVTAELQDKEGHVLATVVLRIVDDKEVLKGVLRTEIQNAESKAEENYTTDSWKKMQTALTEAENVYERTSAKQTEVDLAASDLREAVQSLVKKQAQTETGTKGDINGDGKVNIADVKKLLRMITSETDNKLSMQVADINGDGKINIADVKKLLRNITESL